MPAGPGSRATLAPCLVSRCLRPGAAARAGAEADPVRRRRAQLHRQGLGRGGRSRRRGADHPLGADVPRRLRGRPAQPGRQILYEVLNERDWILAERTYAVWPDMEALMREHGVPQFTVDGHRPVRDFDVFGLSLLHRARLHQHAHRARPGRHPAARASTATTTTRSCSPAATRRSTPSRSPTSSTPPSLGDGEEVVLAISEVVREWKAEGRPGGRDELLLPAGAHRRRLRAERSTTSTTCPTAGSSASCPNRPGVPWRVAQAHADGPRRVALPEAAAGAARRDRARAVLGRDLPRLHARLPVLPGRHDHPPGARALDHTHRRHGRERHPQPASRRSACSRCPAPTTPRSARSPRAWPTATRAPTSRCRCPRPGSTPSTSTWPTSSPATAGAPG